jgi:protein gp37
MAERSSIEWTDATWNPVRGCTKISPGCKHCYAETFAERFRGVKGHPYEQGFDLRLVPDKLPEPLRWRTPKRVFVNSMSDLFHEEVPDSYIESVADVMVQAHWHTYQVLTKRSTRIRTCLKRSCVLPLRNRIFGGGRASKTRSTAFQESTICDPLQQGFASSRLSRC